MALASRHAHEVAAGRTLVRRLLRFVGSLGVDIQDQTSRIQDHRFENQRFGYLDGFRMVHDGH